ncbi:TPA: TIGR04141 family sporadically distributed protein [Mannheimia haemolytica]|uniref:DUF6119 family protein n=5 Tax=Mannheimia haemolytica TaxID=75985 RepID=UPI001E5650C5|nr:DUF6119 family protein [Mannheimia haemolytica]UFK43375.1 TIGR04141 family sporadically distributed protein [Mannheimia haemolytica]HDL1112946.1 TIGR04141 family sporadically distributed protein [Mannheimia haemolytica]HDL1115465.1 TIGR04141 family sporadically distributed protein [Mannheimia haemolytica]HDL1123566.1 TIGR04141 family sporadically distributed protein [Mannheimia haemolytica]HDL1126227.1 TIGR04141 family sporadically distributed protein [Mannheimia haemolytica]
MGQQSFSIYLLKENFNESNSIKGKYKHQLIKLSEKEWDNQELPDASLYLQVNEPKPPVWKNYFNITKDIQNQSQGSVLFIPISAQGQSRYFAITFGHTYHALLKQSIDHNFGLITTLNALKPGESIRAIDTVFPENDRRERIQSPNFTHLEFFHFNKHESLVKSLHGKVKDEYRDVFNNITGTLSFKCNSQKPLSELKELCTKLFEIFSKKDYEDEFPELIHIKPENDPDKIHELDNILLNKVHISHDLLLSIPDFIELSRTLKFEYNGIDSIPEEYDDISFSNYLDYVHQSKINISSLNLEDLHNHTIKCIDENSNEVIGEYSVYECFSIDLTDNQNDTYYLCDSRWYKINKNYIADLKSTLDPHFITQHRVLSIYTHQSEGDYNSKMGINPNTICLDTKNISPKGQTAIEPCDLLSLEQDGLHFIHVKIDTKSASLSHLFNQGLNSLCLIRSNEEAKENLQKLISSDTNFLNALDTQKYTVIYGIVTNKDPKKLSDNLPFFSRISLSRSLEQFKMLGVSCKIIYINKA